MQNIIEEVFIGDALSDVLLSSIGTPPADISVTVSGWSTVQLYSQVLGPTTPGRFGKFNPKDRPRLKGFGIFCNLADGLVANDNPFDKTGGIVVKIGMERFDVSNADLGAAGAYPSGANLPLKVPELNYIMPMDMPFNLTNLAATDDHMRCLVAPQAGAAAAFSTLAINPDFASRRIIFYPMVVIGHDYPLLAVGF